MFKLLDLYCSDNECKKIIINIFLDNVFYYVFYSDLCSVKACIYISNVPMKIVICMLEVK